MTISPKELRNIADVVEDDGGWPLHHDATVVKALRECADLLERSHVVTDEEIDIYWRHANVKLDAV